MRSPEFSYLLNKPHAARREAASVGVSLFVHGVVVGIVAYGMLQNPRIQDPMLAQHFSYRRLELHTADLPVRGAVANKIEYPRPNALQDADSDSAASSITHPSSLVLPPDLLPGHEMLVQPTLRPRVELVHEAPIPSVLIWSPETSTTSEIVAPLPDRPRGAAAIASLAAPNSELKVAARSVTATDRTSAAISMPAATTTPLATQAPGRSQMAPANASKSTLKPAPTSVLSISDLRMHDGKVMLPPVNDKHAPKAETGTAPGPAKEAPGTKKETQAATSNQPGHDAAKSANTSVLDARANSPDSAEHITFAKDGRFGVVVVGSSLAEEYPETEQIWGRRVAYTAYLHVGLPKNWILQYSQTRSESMQEMGSVARLEAPWPYDIVRPNLLSTNLNADALMVHGVLNQEGRFEELAIAFPPRYAHASYVLHTLQQWVFRPARQNGKPTSVEILLIIPEQPEP